MPAKKLWKTLWQPSTRYPVAILIGIGFIVGITFSGALASFVQYSNSMAFCISCHEMESTVYPEYQKTFHYQNPSGVRAACADCHVPHENWLKMTLFKIVKTKELYYHLIGAIDTQENFEAKRLELARKVWEQMQVSDSKACRNCHNTTAMDLAKQRPRAQAMHESVLKGAATCIDCHKGLAHQPVQSPQKEEPEEEGFTL